MLGWQFLLGALIILIAVLLPAPDESDEPYLLATAVTSALIGIGLLVARRTRPIVIDVALVALVLVVTAVVVASRPMGLSPLFYFWPLLMTAIYSTLRQALMTTAVSLGAFALALASGLTSVPDPVIIFVEFAGLTLAIMFAVRRLRSMVVALVSELDSTARIDGLTKVLNRGAFEEEFDRWQGQRDRQPSTSGALLLLDIDHFKAVNDTYGHPAGDSALRQLVVALTAAVREHDVIGRVGGEEFAVLLPATGGHDALAVAERIRAAVEQRSGEDAPAFTVSIGLAGGNAAPNPWDAADRALYAAKRGGRNRVVVAERDGEMAAIAA